jgi:4-diphosphocytidyl-2-C-methyl-D-erythritol kinase
MNRGVRLPAFAKINLCLHVLGRRRDGYHELRTIFQAISLHDTLEVWRSTRPGISLETNDPALPDGEENLVWRAVAALQRALRMRGGVRIRLTKRIPVARGLGGGSSDAAAALLGLLRLTSKKIALEQLLEIAAGLGADVPFFLLGGRALGVGRGDEIYPLPEGKKGHVVVVSPHEAGVSTRDAYRWVSSQLTKSVPAHRIWGFCALCWGPQEEGASNDFEAAVFPRLPRLRKIKARLLQEGAVEAALAGSGSAVFGVFRNPAQARRAARAFPKDQVFVAETLTRADCARARRGYPLP